MINKIGIIIIALVLMVFGVSCGPGPFERGEEERGGEVAQQQPSGAQPGFEKVYEILKGSCMGCHKQGGAAGGTEFLLVGDANQDYNVIMKHIDRENPEESKILKKGGGKVSHGGGKVLSDEDYQVILEFIKTLK